MNTLALTATLFRMAPDARVVTLGSTVTYGAFTDDEQMGTDEMGQPVTVRTRLVHVPAGSLTGVVDGAVVNIRPKGTTTAANVAYTVRGRPRPRENGDVWEISLSRAD